MPIRAMIIAPDIVARATELRAYALQHRFGKAVMERKIAQFQGERPPTWIEEDSPFYLEIPFGIRVGFTIDEDLEGDTWFQHLSVLILPRRVDFLPHPAMVEEILKLFGMPEIKDCDFNIDEEHAPGSVDLFAPLEEIESCKS